MLLRASPAHVVNTPIFPAEAVTVKVPLKSCEWLLQAPVFVTPHKNKKTKMFGGMRVMAVSEERLH